MTIKKEQLQAQKQFREDVISLIEHGIVYIEDMEKIFGYYIGSKISAMVKARLISPVYTGERTVNCNPVKYYKIGGDYIKRPIKCKEKVEETFEPHYLYEYFPVVKPEGTRRIVKLTNERHNGKGLSVKAEFNIQSGIG